MHIEVTDLDDRHIENFSCTPITFQRVLNKVMLKYPPGRYHAKLHTY